jgi:diguanylate cyclase (GGDEF)-like protein
MKEMNEAEEYQEPPLSSLWLKILQDAYVSGELPDKWPAHDENLPGWKKLVEELVSLQTCLRAISNGDLAVEPSGKNAFAGSLKTLQANLRHLTWQVQQVAAGDLSQKVEFPGEFSQALNQVIGNLEMSQQAERDQRILAEALRDTSAALNSAMNRDQMFDSLLSNLSKVVPHDTVDIILVTDGIAKIVRTDGYQQIDPDLVEKVYALKLPIDTTPNLKIMNSTGQPLKIADLAEHPWPSIETADWAKSHLGVPILVKGKTSGFLILLSSKLDFFTDEHVARLQAFADQVAIAIDKAQLFEQLNEMASIDSLTGIANRRYFFNLAEAEITRALRYKHPLSALMMDIDHFKVINDTYGHNIGDQVLQAVTKRCMESMRDNDLMGRYGGEEFAFILPETDLNAAVKVADRLRKIIASQPFQFQGISLKVTVSIGVSQFRIDIPSARALLDHADLAMYSAKQSGRNRVTKVD